MLSENQTSEGIHYLFFDVLDITHSHPEKTAKLMEYCVQIGLSIRDADLLTIGMVNDMYAENRKKYKEIATHKDFDIF